MNELILFYLRTYLLHKSIEAQRLSAGSKFTNGPLFRFVIMQTRFFYYF